jgi:hypothetical protein
MNSGYDGDSVHTSIHGQEIMNVRYREHCRMVYAEYSIELSMSTNCS